ncbi:MAG: HEAT repeat domain-containing protein [Candidatus Bilamarchaeaceae archaeon]
MGKMLGIRPPSSCNGASANCEGRKKIGTQAWDTHSFYRREAKFFELLRALGKGNADQRKKAAIETAKSAYLADSPYAKEIILERIENEKTSFVRAHLLRIIGAMAAVGIDCAGFLPKIRELLAEGSDFEKMEAANALRKMGDRRSLPPLTEALKSGEGLYPPAKKAIRDAIDSLSEGKGEKHSDSCGTGIDIST